MLLPSLNALLAALSLPFTLDDPTDLTPSLLLAILESLMSARLPIPNAIRQSRTRDAKSRAMLVFLGVLECDILRGGTDADQSISGVSVEGWADEIGLGEVDPERLAEGGYEETIFIGNLLCWLARRKGILPRTTSSHRPRSLYSNHHAHDSADLSSSLLRPSSEITDIPRHPLVHSPEPSFSASVTTGTDLSIRARSVSSHTTLSDESQETIQMYDDEDDDRPPRFRPHCIHEVDDPSYFRAPSHISENEEDDEDGLYVPPTPSPRRVRLDPTAELASRSRGLHKVSPPRRTSRTLRRISPSPSPPPSPPPAPSSPSPSPPHSDAPFDISFSSLNNTSTPAKPRPRRPQLQPQATSGRLRVSRPREARSPSYTPSPPSFSAPSRSRGTPTPNVPSAIEPAMKISSSTAMTNSLLTERARLLTELAALKRARAVSGSAHAGTESGTRRGRVRAGI